MVRRLTVPQQLAVALSSKTLELHQSAEPEAHKLAGVLGMFEQDNGIQIARQIEHLGKDGD